MFQELLYTKMHCIMKSIINSGIIFENFDDKPMVKYRRSHWDPNIVDSFSAHFFIEFELTELTDSEGAKLVNIVWFSHFMPMFVVRKYKKCPAQKYCILKIYKKFWYRRKIWLSFIAAFVRPMAGQKRKGIRLLQRPLHWKPKEYFRWIH